MKILDCKLLSVEEAEKIDKLIMSTGYWWWLRSPSDEESNYAAHVKFDGGVNTYGDHIYCNSDFGVRPALWLESYAGKSFKLAGYNWINVFDNVYLCEYSIGEEIFDEKSNKYEGSHVQKFILSWFKSQGLEFNTEIKVDECIENIDKEAIKDFIYKVDESNKLNILIDCDSIDEFFNEPVSNESFKNKLIIMTVDTKMPLITVQKDKKDDTTVFKFIVDITTENEDKFVVSSIINTQAQLNELIESTITALRSFKQFNKYADDLEEYIK